MHNGRRCHVQLILLLAIFDAITALSEATLLHKLFERLYLIITISCHGAGTSRVDFFFEYVDPIRNSMQPLIELVPAISEYLTLNSFRFP